MANRKSCVIYDSWAEMIVNMPDDTAGQLIKNMMKYVFDKGETEFTSPEVQAMFCMIKAKLDEDTIKYQAKVERLNDNASKSERNRNDIGTISNRNRNDIGGVSDSVSVSDSVTVSDSESDTDTESPSETKKREARARFTPPTVEQVKEYCDERGNGVNPETFVDFYASKGWKVGRNPMKDWKASVRTWEKRDNRGSPEKFDSNAYLLGIIGGDG